MVSIDDKSEENKKNREGKSNQDKINLFKILYCIGIGIEIVGVFLIFLLNFQGSIWVSLSIVVLGLVFALYFYSQHKKYRSLETEKKLKEIDFKVDKQIEVNCGKYYAMQIDMTKKKWAMAHNDGSIEVFDFKDILKYEIYENGASKVKGTAGKSLVGGLFFGIGGAIVAGNSSKKINEFCTQLELHIYLNKLDNSDICLNFVNGIKVNKNSSQYQSLRTTLQQISSIFELMINNKEIDNESVINVEKVNKKEELQELKEMLVEGLITEKEFEENKKKILEK